jgi:electron transfer flavoprotein alpha subunit
MSESDGIWILAEQSNGRVLRISHELLRRGRALANKRGCPLTAVLPAAEVPEEALQDLLQRGADRVLLVTAPALAHFQIDPYARCLQWLIETHHPEVLLAGATSTGRTLLPYVAVKVHAGLTADCTELDIDPETGDLLQTRPAIGGNILATIRTPNHRPQMATVRPRSTKPAERTPGRGGEIVRLTLPEELSESRTRRVGFEPFQDTRGIEEADRVVVVGRGFKKAENLTLARELAGHLDAALGATRDVVDRGWLAYPHQIGLSGKTVTPTLYLGVGVSGSIQHLAGMQTAETIVAINSDPEAQLFRVADFGIVADLFEVLPVLNRKLNKSSG